VVATKCQTVWAVPVYMHRLFVIAAEVELHLRLAAMPRGSCVRLQLTAASQRGRCFIQAVSRRAKGLMVRATRESRG
jgi:hypothetical protein